MEDLPFWLDLAARAGDPILELGCGTGRVLIPLAQAGHCCIGLDRDLGMLDFLQAKLVTPSRSQPMLVAADMRRFSLAEQFSLIIIPCNTLSTLNDGELEACLTCVQRHVQPQGLFAASMPNPELLKHLPVRSRPEIEEEFTLPPSSNPVQVSSGWRRTEHEFIVTWIYDVLHPDGTIVRLTMRARHSLRPVQAYLDGFRAAGLSISDMYGDFDRSRYRDDSPSLVVVAETSLY